MTVTKSIYRLLAQTCLAVCLILPQQVGAWSLTGHRIIGQIAESHLKCRTERRVRAILNGADLAMECNWGDFVKSDPHYTNYYNWHFHDIPGGLTRAAFETAAIGRDNGENIYRVQWLIAHLRQEPNDTNMLRMLIHIVGDMGCPMHLGHPEDRGGNDITVQWFGHNTKLHAVWDSELINCQKLSYTEYANHLQNTHTHSNIRYTVGCEMAWAWETYQLTERIYAHNNTILSYSYVYEFLPLLNEQLWCTGCRLAAILNYIYA